MHEWILFDGRYTSFLKYIPQATHYGMLIFMLCAAFLQIKRKEKSIESGWILSMLGMMLFLLIWESRSRYLFTMLPVMLMLEGYSIEQIANIRFRKKGCEKLSFFTAF